MSPNEASIESEWEKGPQTIEVPGGKHARVRRRPLDTFYKAGKIPNALMPAVRAAIIKGDDFNVEDFNDQQIFDLLSVMDMIVVECTETPRVYPIPVCRTCHGVGTADQEVGPAKKKTIIKVDCPACEARGEEPRDPDRVYVDEVPFDTKNFIYSYVIGVTEDLKSFLEQTNGSVESVPERETVGSKAK
jgi:hypothetical protein